MHYSYLDTTAKKNSCHIPVCVKISKIGDYRARDYHHKLQQALNEQYCDLQKCSREVIDTIMSS